MPKLVVGLVVSLLWIWPIALKAGEPGRAGERPPEQQRILTKERIQQLQERLKTAWLAPSPIDETLGTQTQAALRAFQQQWGIPVSGTIDEATRQALLGTSVLSEAVQEVQTTRAVPQDRPEQQLSEHDRSDLFQATEAQLSSTSFANQPDQDKVLGFEFYRDPLNANRAMQTFHETMQADVQEKPGIMAAQQQLLDRRHNLRPRFDPDHGMSRGASRSQWNQLRACRPAWTGGLWRA
jgi:Putative peptidoglycan binding domain